MFRTWTRNLLGRLLGQGGCLRCGDTWDWKEAHTTEFGRSEGCFPLCEECWATLTPETRWPYYEQLVQAWEMMDQTGHSRLYREALGIEPAYAVKREQIRTAVMAGK